MALEVQSTSDLESIFKDLLVHLMAEEVELLESGEELLEARELCLLERGLERQEYHVHYIVLFKLEADTLDKLLIVHHHWLLRDRESGGDLSY